MEIHPGTRSYERLLSPRPPISSNVKPRHYRGMIQSPYAVSTDKNSNADTMKSSMPNSMFPDSKQVHIIPSPIRHVESDSHSHDSGLGALTQERNFTRKERQLAPGTPAGQRTCSSVSSSQLAVRHVSTKGIQEGLLFPKYQIDSTSKCIMCKDCGIFFSHDVFLRHLHDVYGKKVECYGQLLELSIDVPNREQLRLFQEFLSNIGLRQDKILNNTGSHQGSEAHLAASSMRINSPAATNTWTKGIQDTVLASEKLLKETSDYLKSSAKKMKHRRQNSFQLQGLPSALSKKEDNTSETLPANSSVPIIKTHNSHRSSKKSLQRYFQSNPTIQMRGDKPKPLMMHAKNPLYPTTDRTQTDFEVSKDEVNVAKSSNVSSHQHIDNLLKHHQQDSISSQNILSPKKHVPSSLPTSQHPVEDSLTHQLTGSLHIEAFDSMPKLSRSGDDRASSQMMNSRGDFGAITVDDLLTSKVEQLPKLGQDKKDDPVYILQTAQDLITLAAHKIGQNTSSDTTTDWFSKYKAEHTQRLKNEAIIQELQGALQDEQKKRKELEIQLRAMRLQTT